MKPFHILRYGAMAAILSLGLDSCGSFSKEASVPADTKVITLADGRKVVVSAPPGTSRVTAEKPKKEDKKKDSGKKKSEKKDSKKKTDAKNASKSKKKLTPPADGSSKRIPDRRTVRGRRTSSRSIQRPTGSCSIWALPRLWSAPTIPTTTLPASLK